MKSVILASALVLSASSAFALDLGASAEIAYSVENEQVDLNVGPDVFLGSSIILAPRVNAHWNADDSLTFEGLSIEATYGLGNGLTLFGNVDTNEFEYSDAQIGVRFQF